MNPIMASKAYRIEVAGHVLTLSESEASALLTALMRLDITTPSIPKALERALGIRKAAAI
jgi:hypothetical protein